MVGFISGKMTLENSLMGPAPSMTAASSISRGSVSTKAKHEEQRQRNIHGHIEEDKPVPGVDKRGGLHDLHESHVVHRHGNSQYDEVVDYPVQPAAVPRQHIGRPRRQLPGSAVR